MRAVAFACVLAALAQAAAAAEHVKIAVVSSLASVPLYLAATKGYFAEEGLDAELVQFQSAQPVAVAVTSGDIDFGSTGMTAALFALASGGQVRIIGSGTWERPGFKGLGFVVSNQAYAAGVRSFDDQRGRAVAITQLGTPLQYALARVLMRHKIDLKTVRVLGLQSNPNVASAVTGGQVDAAVASAANIYALVDPGNAKLLGWLGEELGVAAEGDGTFTSRTMADEHPDTVRHFLAAFRKAERTWDAAFVDANGNRQDQAAAPEMIAMAAKALSQPESVIRLSVEYFDPQSRISVSDIQHALDWYESEGMLKGHVDANALIDTRYAEVVP